MKAPLFLAQLLRQAQAHAVATGNHDAAHGRRVARIAAVQGRQHMRNVLLRCQHKHLVTRLDAGAARAGDKTVGLVRKAAVDGHQPHRHIGRAGTQLSNGVAHHGRPCPRTH